MKSFLLSLFVLLTLSPALGSCSTEALELPPPKGQPTTPDEPSNDGNDTDKPMGNKMKITIGTTSYNVTLENNAAATAFKALLPMTLNMSDLNDNEKFYNLSTALPTAASRPGTIHTGDLMLFGSNCLVLFYETFSTSYSYTRLGRIDNPSGLFKALGDGNRKVRFEIINL